MAPDPLCDAQVKSEKDSIGGTVACVLRNVPPALGEPVFDRLEAKLAHAMLSLPATKGFEFGSGFGGTVLRGSVHNDPFVAIESPAEGTAAITHKKNHAGGTLGLASANAAQSRPLAHALAPNLIPDSLRLALRPPLVLHPRVAGGISSGADVYFRVAVKPVSTIGRAQSTATFGGSDIVLEAKGRHDPCVLPRTPPLVEGMAALVLADAALIQRTRLGGSNTVASDARQNFAPMQAAVNGAAEAAAKKQRTA